VREFDFSGMEIIWGSRYTVTEHEKAVEWEEETSPAAASLSRARRRQRFQLGAVCASKRNEMK